MRDRNWGKLGLAVALAALIVFFAVPGLRKCRAARAEETGAESRQESFPESSQESRQDSSPESQQESCGEAEEESMTESLIPSAGGQNIRADMIPDLRQQFGEEPPAKQASRYHSYWELWCEGGSADAAMRQGGCRVIAIAKLLAESGLLDPGEDDPDSFLAWARRDSGHPEYFQNDMTEWFRPDVNTGETLTTGASAVAWARMKGVTLVQHQLPLSGGNSAADQELVLQKLREGCYVILEGDYHQAYVGRSLSLEAGQVYLLDSFSDCSWSWWQLRPLAGYSLDGYTTLYYYELQ